ncbi:hypothetical protein WG936_09050 [Corynebacterium sp. H127]|uniref:hypothetical protein n=1 Tax=Corynebacterium sp. H127 TaxID=3133418 RepID=UPI0030990553
MRLVHNMGEQAPSPRRDKPQWVQVAETALWGELLDTAMDADGNVDADPHGVVEVHCHRTPSTDLRTARYILKIERVDNVPVLVECSRHDLRALALALLDAAQHAVPVELQRAGYEHAVMPWFDGGNNGGGAA